MSNNKEFKAESKRLLELMINSIYTNKEIFLRELISNASDAIDKLHYRSLTDKNLDINKSDLKIRIDLDKEARTITITDNGCGMTEEELDNNLGTIAKSGSLAFKEANEKKDGIDIIGQFGVGFYSAFMVADEVIVTSRSIDSDAAYMWRSKGVEGYSINKADKAEIGTQIVLHIKEDTEDEKYSEFLDENRIQTMIRKYSDYIHYPIEMELEHSHKVEGSDEYVKVREMETINSMVPIWKKDKKNVTEEEYNSFYTEKYFDYEKPLKVIHTSVEGQCKYDALLYIPSKLPFNYYSEEFERGLQLYSSGVLIMDRCEDLIPDYFGFVKGLVDSDDLSLNISREMLQQDRQVKIIAKNIENKIRSELENILNNDREKYEEFFKDFGFQLKFGTYNDYGRNKEKLQDLLLFYSSTEKKMVTLSEYVGRKKKDQKAIYYASGDSVDKIDMLPQVETLKEKEYEVLYLTDKIDEFVLQTIMMYKDNTFQNASAESVDLDTVEEKEALEKLNAEHKDLFTFMKEKISSQVQEVRFTHRLKNHPVCLTSEGNLSVDMAKAINAMPNNQNVQARLVLEINEKHEIANKLKALYNEDKELLEKYTKILYAQAKLIEGMELDNPTEISNLVCELMTK